MAHNILLTGSSGYLGGDLLASLSSSGALPAYNKLYALVRTETQADAVRNYGAEPLTLDVKDEAAVKEAVLSKNLTVVFFLIDSATAESQVYFLNALGELKKKTGAEVHFLHVSFFPISSVLHLQKLEGVSVLIDIDERSETVFKPCWSTDGSQGAR